MCTCVTNRKRNHISLVSCNLFLTSSPLLRHLWFYSSSEKPQDDENVQAAIEKPAKTATMCGQKLTGCDDWQTNTFSAEDFPDRILMTNYSEAGKNSEGPSVNTQWQVPRRGAHPSTRKPTYTHKRWGSGVPGTCLHTCHAPCVWLSPLPTAHKAHTHTDTHWGTKADTHAAWRQVGSTHRPIRTHTHACKPYTQWHYYPLALNAKMSAGKQHVCVCVWWLCASTACVCVDRWYA